MACRSCLESRRRALRKMPRKAAELLARKLLPADMPLYEDAPAKPAPKPEPVAQLEPVPVAQLVPAQRLIDAARALVGTKYLHQGRNAAGVDCIGFVALAAQRAGLDLVRIVGGDVRNYTQAASPDFLARVQAYATRIDAPVPGALVLFKWPAPTYPQHAAIYTERGTIIHALLRRRQVVEHGYRDRWLAITHSVWKIPGVLYDAP